jgi:hypothetical protein
MVAKNAWTMLMPVASFSGIAAPYSNIGMMMIPPPSPRRPAMKPPTSPMIASVPTVIRSIPTS